MVWGIQRSSEIFRVSAWGLVPGHLRNGPRAGLEGSEHGAVEGSGFRVRWPPACPDFETVKLRVSSHPGVDGEGGG